MYLGLLNGFDVDLFVWFCFKGCNIYIYMGLIIFL